MCDMSSSSARLHAPGQSQLCTGQAGKIHARHVDAALAHSLSGLLGLVPVDAKQQL